MTSGGREPAGASSHDDAPAGHIICCLCLLPIPLDQYRSARCWVDPNSISCAAHDHCLTWIGENLDLPAPAV